MEPQIAGLASYILKFIVFLFLIAFLAGGFIYQAKDSINKRFKNENEKLLK